MTLFDPPAADEGLNLKTVTGLLTLLAEPGIGPTKAVALAGEFANWPVMAAAGTTALARIGGKAAVALAGRDEPAHRVVGSVPGVRTVGFFDGEFPARLRDIPSPPAVLWVAGTLPADHSIAVVGTRHPTGYGTEVAQLVATEAVKHGFGVVSGLALGIDTTAHETTLQAGGVTWAVLGSGVDVPTPPTNTGLAERIVAAGGGLIAEVPPGVPVSGRALVARDRLQSGMARAVVVAQSGIPSGTLHTARFALEQHRILAVARPPDRLSGEPESAANLALTDPDGCDPAMLKATGGSARRIAARHPAADIVLRDRSDLPGLWELARQ